MEHKSFKRVLYTGLTSIIAASLSLGSAVLPAHAAPSSREVCASTVSVGDTTLGDQQKFVLENSGMTPPVSAGENYQIPSDLDDVVDPGLACTLPWTVQGPELKDGFFQFDALADGHDSYFDSNGFLHVSFTDVTPGASGIVVKLINAATAGGSRATNNVFQLRWQAANSPSGTQPTEGTTYSTSWTYGPFDATAQAQLNSGALIVGVFAMGISVGVTSDTITTLKATVWTSTGGVSFNANGGTGTMENQFGSSTQALASNSFTRPGFAFAGWTTNQDGTGDSYADGADFDFSADQELFAQWTATDTTAPVVTGSASVTVTAPSKTVSSYTADEAVTTWALSGTDSALFDITGGVVTFKSASVIGTYSFNILATDAYGNTSTTAVTVRVSSATVPATNKVVTFNANGGVGARYSFKSKFAAKLPANKFTRKGFVFAGWNTKADGSGTSYKNEATFPFTAYATLFAQWAVVKSAKRIAIFKGDDASLKPDMKYTIRTWINKLPAGASITCEGSTSGLKVTAFDKALAKSRAKNVCEYAKTIRKGLKYTLTINPSSANDMQARHVWMRSN